MKHYVKQLLALCLAVLLSSSFLACGVTNNSSNKASTSDATTTEATTATVVSYPLTITDHLGRTVTIDKEPESIVSGYYITTSLMIALGLSDKLVGVEAKANTRKIYSLASGADRILSLPNVGTAKAFDLEGCVALNPDLVVLPVKLKDAVTALEQLGITVIAVNPEDQQLLFETMDLIDSATNTVSKGNAVKDMILSSLAQLKEMVTNAASPSVYLAGNSSVLETAGPAMYQNSMIEAAGGSNAASSISDTYWANVSYEQLLSWNPEYIFLAADASYTVDSILSDVSLSDCTAVKNKHVYQLPNAVESVDSPIPASFLGSVYMASILHSDLITSDFYKNLTSEFYQTFYGFTPNENEK